MAGQVFGKLDCYSWYTGTNVYQNAQEFFKGLYDFLMYLESQGVVTLRARFAGLSASADSIGYWDETNPFTSNAWYLFEWRTGTTTPANSSYAGIRNEPFYILAQYVKYNDTWGAAPGSGPALANGSANNGSNDHWVAIQMGVGIGGDKNPWNGTLGTYGDPNSFGNQAKGNPVWKVPTGGLGLYVFPRSNSEPGGAHLTSKQSLNLVFNTGPTASLTRYSFLADHDGLLILHDNSFDVNYHFTYTGVYVRRENLPVLTDPYIMIGGLTVSFPAAGTVFGGITGTSTDSGGIAFNTYGQYEVRNVKISMLSEVLGLSGNQCSPNRLFSFYPSTYDALPCLVCASEYYDGYAGSIEFFQVVQNISNLSFNSDGTKLVIGTPTVTNYKMLIPWIVGLNPLSFPNRLGVTGLCG